MKITVFAFLFLAQISWAQTQQIYQGTSPVMYDNKNVCRVTLTLDSQKQIIAINAEGPAKQWEILSENGGSYGPESSIVMVRNDELLSKPETFARMNFVRTNHFWSDGYTLKSSMTAEGSLKAKFELEFKMRGSQFLAYKQKSKFKAMLIPLGSKELVCENLKKITR